MSKEIPRQGTKDRRRLSITMGHVRSLVHEAYKKGAMHGANGVATEANRIKHVNEVTELL